MKTIEKIQNKPLPRLYPKKPETYYMTDSTESDENSVFFHAEESGIKIQDDRLVISFEKLVQWLPKWVRCIQYIHSSKIIFLYNTRDGQASSRAQMLDCMIFPVCDLPIEDVMYEVIQ